MATKPTAAVDRINAANGNAYDASTNPGGLAQGGHRQNFVPDLQAAVAVAQWSADSAAEAASNTASTAADRVQTGQDRTAASQSATNSANSATEANNQALRAQQWAESPENVPVVSGQFSAKHWSAKAQSWAAGVSLPAISAANAYQILRVKADGSGYETYDLPPTPPILPITMTAPASGATDVGAGGTYTFVARAFVGDTTGFYSNYGVPVASRFVNVYEPSGTNPVKTFTAAGGGPSLVANFTGSGLVVSHAYQFEFGYTDAQGNTVKSPKVSATTASQFKPSEGQAYQGGFLGFQNFGDGDLFDLVVAPKSTEASRQWNGGNSTSLSTLSRLNGPSNTALYVSQGVGDATSSAQKYANSISIGGVTGYLGAIDELRAISSKLRPGVAVEAAFKTGGAEVFTDAGHWSSTEIDSSIATRTDMTSGSNVTSPKTNTFNVRAIKRVSTIAPYPIGTAMEGGYLAAYFTDLSSGSPVTYMLIVADKATEVTRAWDNANSGAINYRSRTNGKQYDAEISALPALQYANSLVSGGKTDWYLGAIDEMLAIARMNSQLPSAQRLPNQTYWTSTEISSSVATSMDTGVERGADGKSTALFVRPIRRVLLPAT